MSFNSLRLLASLCLGLNLANTSSHAAVIVTYAEQPGETNSTLIGTDVFTFDSLKTGMQTNVTWTGVGSFDQLFIKSADAYGGAASDLFPNGSRYSVQGAGTKVLSSTLTLDEASSYFGLWWSAGDARNVLQFYSGDALVAEFTTASLLAPLPKDYYGNPLNPSINRGEPYAFINFFGDGSTSWDRIVFTNEGSSGFESDNYTTRVEAWDPLVDGALPGVPVAIVSGEDTKLITENDLQDTLWAAAPGAPLPPLPLLALFGVIALIRSRLSVAQSPQHA
jgi:hypothetical protein